MAFCHGRVFTLKLRFVRSGRFSGIGIAEPRVRSWLQAEVSTIANYVRSTPSTGHWVNARETPAQVALARPTSRTAGYAIQPLAQVERRRREIHRFGAVRQSPNQRVPGDALIG